MHSVPAISLASLLPVLASVGCIPRAADRPPAVISGGEVYEHGCTVTGSGTWCPEARTRTFSGPVYILPAATLDALLAP